MSGQVAPRPRLFIEKYFSDDVLKAVGILTLESSMLEQRAEQLITAIVGEQIAGMLLDRKMIDAKLTILRDLLALKVRSKIRMGKLTKIFSDTKTDITRRNIVVHGRWGHNDDDVSISALIDGTARPKNPFATRGGKGNPVNADEVMDIAIRLVAHGRAINRFWLESKRNKPPWLQKYRKQSAHQSKT